VRNTLRPGGGSSPAFVVSARRPLLEPLGLLYAAAAADAVAAGQAAWLAGGPLAFSLVRTLDDGRIVPLAEIPEILRPALTRLAQAPPAWAGLPTGRPLVMGVVNVTPDSFSDGGLHAAFDVAVTAGRAMVAAGADIVDIGGDSTRPGAQPTPVDVEHARVLPVIRALAAEGAVISVDTRNAATMRSALDAGARIVNDVAALAHDPAAAALVAARGCPVVLMHMRGEPGSMQRLTRYGDIAADVTGEMAVRLAAAERAGIDRAAVALDPGIGFAKSASQNEALLARLPVLLNLGCRLVVGVSRKGFIGRLAGEPEPLRRLPGSLAAGMMALFGGASVLRVHDVAETVQAVRVWQGIAGHTIPA
jgi:dihydropteroate synthase